MNVYSVSEIGELIRGNSYVGRGIVVGKSDDGKKAVFAYFIMGRSENSRNRVFVENGEEVNLRLMVNIPNCKNQRRETDTFT